MWLIETRTIETGTHLSLDEDSIYWNKE